MTRISRSTYYCLHRPSRCPRRLRLFESGAPASDPSPLEEIVIELGARHEAEYLSTLASVLELKEGSHKERVARTQDALQRKTNALAHALLRSTWPVRGDSLEIVGEPDLLVPARDGWIIRDVKLTRHVSEHPEIAAQMDLYGALLERTTGRAPVRLEVVLGDDSLEHIEYAGLAAVEGSIADLLEHLRRGEAYEPVGWSKCQGCGYREQCWPEAEKRQDVALLPTVDQGLAHELHARGIRSIRELSDKLPEEELRDLQRPWGRRTQRVGKKAGTILLEARCFLEERPLRLGVNNLPAAPNVLVLDLEGIPPFLDGPEEIFLWGMKVFGERPSPYSVAYTIPGETGDEATWGAFLRNAAGVFETYGDLPILHWASYEKTKLRLYRDRYGDREGIAERIDRNLCNLLSVCSEGICLPLPSRSLKVVEKYVGYERKVQGNGEWAVAQYVRAVSTDNPDEATRLVTEVLRYNEEDLDATWANSGFSISSILSFPT
ncbi:MAG: TM0106 family RecB-like putative nuclease [Candidatus Eisenbacteria bacterium]